MNVVSGHGCSPRIGPVPIRNGRMYSEPPLPYGGTYSAFARTWKARRWSGVSRVARTVRLCGRRAGCRF
eukprot:5591445-Prymnesium_polylepis.1